MVRLRCGGAPDEFGKYRGPLSDLALRVLSEGFQFKSVAGEFEINIFQRGASQRILHNPMIGRITLSVVECAKVTDYCSIRSFAVAQPIALFKPCQQLAGRTHGDNLPGVDDCNAIAQSL